MTNLIIQYSDVFFVKGIDALKATNILEHEITLVDEKTVFIIQYPVP